MELEFDKEIDAILRKAREPVSAGHVSANGDHIDADAIAAFAENALPDKARLLYTEHLADCDRCRQMLSQSILMNREADATAASTVVSAPAVEAVVPWYRQFLKAPNLAYSMGTLVLIFAGILGYMVLQNRSENEGSTVSQVTDQQPSHGGPYFNEESPIPSSNAASNTANKMTASNATAANVPANTQAAAANPAPGGTGRGETTVGGVGAPEKNAELDGISTAAGKPVITAASPPAPANQPKADTEVKLAAKEKTIADNKDAALAGRDAVLEDRNAREEPSKALKRTDGPSRASGQVQQQNSNVILQTPTRQVSDKSFDFRGGVWYDLAYHGQATVNVRRGTDEYKKLDGGLRNIADSLGGTVVVVWKSKAYRIQ